ncbi:hypothetical protein AALO_G00095690 [Alosa alosa]|uniref:NTR domain-containing protein n=1 Tax=Alosa alosa TaxID=278164 RepID=A0AAV6GWE9_9TELE|nr:complement C3-like [Alosa alosa]KAG5278146.1 hypothetical protein AALO_G00095690 [Alosa alosa]
MRLDVYWLAALALCLVVLSPHADADDRVKCPEKCSPQKAGVRSLAELAKEACSKSMKFAYQVQVENVESTSSTDAYNVTVLESFKEGGVEDPIDETRVFLSRPTCKTNLNLKTGGIYLIMGKNAQQVAGKYHYLFDDHTWVQYWPTDAEGTTNTYKNQYDNLEQFRQDMEFGCKSR